MNDSFETLKYNTFENPIFNLDNNTNTKGKKIDIQNFSKFVFNLLQQKLELQLLHEKVIRKTHHLIIVYFISIFNSYI